nr:AraC family transcriptional regulator [Clostridium sp. MCC353]
MGLAKIGAVFRISEGYLSSVFKEQTGTNFADYLEKIRIDQACELLKNEKMTINEIAQKVGYNSVQSFRRAFKRVKNMSPKEARN